MVRNNRRAHQFLYMFKNLELLWLELNLKDYPAGTTLEAAQNRERKSLDYWFELARVAEGARVLRIVFLKHKVLDKAIPVKVNLKSPLSYREK